MDTIVLANNQQSSSVAVSPLVAYQGSIVRSFLSYSQSALADRGCWANFESEVNHFALTTCFQPYRVPALDPARAGGVSNQLAGKQLPHVDCLFTNVRKLYPLCSTTPALPLVPVHDVYHILHLAVVVHSIFPCFLIHLQRTLSFVEVP